MATRQYIGARYVTKIYENSLDPSSAEWEASINYEPLTMVTYNNGSYLSKKTVPASVGDPASNPTYWAQTGFYNGQIATLQAQIDAINLDINTTKDGNLRIVAFPTTNPVTSPVGMPCGHIMAIIVNNHAMLVDLGLYTAFTDIKNQLQALGIEYIDAVIISHYHGDHDGNGHTNYEHWKTNFNMDDCVFYLPPDVPALIPTSDYETTTEALLRATFTDNTFLKPPYTVTFYDFNIDVFNNTSADYAYYVAQNITDYNEYSQIVRVEHAGVSVLNLSDVSSTAQTRQMSEGNFKRSTIVTVPHHGNDGVGAAGLAKFLKPQYVYASDSYYVNAHYLRDPFLIDAIRQGAVFIDNVANYPDTVTGNFSKFDGLGGSVQKVNGYSTYFYNDIYIDETASDNVYQDGSQDYPFSSLERAISACVGYTNVWHILGDMSSSVVITGEQNHVVVEGNGHKCNFTLRDGASVKLNDCIIDLYLYISDSTVNITDSTISGGGAIYSSNVFIDNDCAITTTDIGLSNAIVMYKGTMHQGNATLPHD